MIITKARYVTQTIILTVRLALIPSRAKKRIKANNTAPSSVSVVYLINEIKGQEISPTHPYICSEGINTFSLLAEDLQVQ
jgi:hypothetical protein